VLCGERTRRATGSKHYYLGWKLGIGVGLGMAKMMMGRRHAPLIWDIYDV
jgi:hypothetical protein